MTKRTLLLLVFLVPGCEEVSAQSNGLRLQPSPSIQRPTPRPSMERPASGIPVDATGGVTIDPTENVKALVAAEKERSNDLRDWQMKYLDIAIANIKEQANLRAEHLRELRANDIERGANIRQVDITNADSAAAQTQVAIKALADGVENTRKTLADAQAQLAQRVDERLGALERSESLVRGTSRVADPALAALTDRVESLVAAQARGTGKGEGADALWGYLVAAITLIIAITGAFVITRRTATAAVVAPAVVELSPKRR